MAHNKLPLVLFLSSLFIHAALGAFVCEDLPNDVCAFSVSSAGKRCLIETMAKNNEGVEYQCWTSEVMVEGLAEYMETDECVNACGVERKSVGISSDALLEPQFMGKLCSPNCYQKCPNIVELYFNLAAGEGVFLPDLCERQRSNPHRAMIELMSSGDAAPGPVSSTNIPPTPSPFPNDNAPAPAPF
ncbi:uncharacterized protein LOC126798019 isoform X2 [Argentina anserina]|uniref:uncharacterized protein LOC126798019 isoform X2 n=1 Tax=Argentina anserina TaxID=57926 RepID=UPI0021767976|nr:uncharacterized protein LOC126798019 isoform X2 [Potentilla anserina]